MDYNPAEGRPYWNRTYNIRHGRASTFGNMLVKVLQTIHREFAVENLRNANESKRVWSIAERADKERVRRMQTAFYGKVFQFRTCLDCNKEFETLYPDKFFAGRYNETIAGSVRCILCRTSRRLAIHGGGPSRRCKQFGIPYENISYRTIFLRDNWTCKICGIHTPESKRGTFEEDAPEVDHIWPLSLVVDGVKSPGHVLSNCQAACRKCNNIKAAKGNQ